jgi:hypothetical protein
MGDNANTEGTNRRPGFRHTPVSSKLQHDMFISKPKDPSRQSQASALYDLSNMRWSQRVRCQAVCASRTPMKEGVRTLSQPYHYSASGCDERRTQTSINVGIRLPAGSRTSDAQPTGLTDGRGVSVKRRFLESQMNQCVLLSNPQPASGAERGKSHDTLPPIHAGLRRVAAALNAGAGP